MKTDFFVIAFLSGAINAEGAANVQFVDAAGTCEISAAAGDGTATPTASILAYSGGPLKLKNFQVPVYVDLKGLQIKDGQRPLLRDHDQARSVGHFDSAATRIDAAGFHVPAGVLSVPGKNRDELVEAHKNGFKWKASIGADIIGQPEILASGQTASVNGRLVQGPAIISRRTEVREVSFVSVAGDDNSNVSLAASFSTGVGQMNFSQWLAAKGLVEATLSAADRTRLEAEYQAEITAAGGTPVIGGAPTGAAGGSAGGVDVGSQVREMQRAAAAEVNRVNRLTAICASHRDLTIQANGAAVNLLEHAILNNWTAEQTELHVLRNARPAAPAIHAAGGSRIDGMTIEAAVSLTNGIEEEYVVRDIPQAQRERVMNEAVSGQMRGFGLHALMRHVIQAAGMHAGPVVNDDFIRAAFQAERVLAASGATAVTVSSVTANVANKAALAAYLSVDQSWRQFVGIGTASNFNTYTQYRLEAGGGFEEVNMDGELKHGSMEESNYTNRLKTYGQVLTLPRQMILSDSLGQFLQIPRLMGRKAGMKLLKIVWESLLGNTDSFFSSGNANKLTGGSSALSIDALAAAEALFLNQVDGDGDPVGVTPAVLVVCSALKPVADQIYVSTTLNETTTANKGKGVANPYANRFKPVVAPHISNANITNNSSTKWLLFSDPAENPACELAFFNGRQEPVVEQAETSFTTLGMQYRAYFDFGFGKLDPKCAVLSDGA